MGNPRYRLWRVINKTVGPVYSGPTFKLKGFIMSIEQIGTGTDDGMKFGGPFGTSDSPLELTYAEHALAMYSTCESTDTSTSFEPVLFSSALTGAGQVGGRVKMYLSITAAAGGWTNAAKSQVVYGASGSTSGLGSAHCFEMTLSAGTSSGTYAPVEIELNAGTGASTGTATSFMYLSMQGDGVATPRASAHLFSLNGVGSATAASMFDTCVATPASHALRILIDGTPYYIMLTNNVDDT
jgi:hypothetical protein